MRLPGLIDLVGLAVTLAFALPVGLLGFNMAMDGRPVGAALLAVAALMVALPHYLWSPPSLGDLGQAATSWVLGGGREPED